MRFCCNIGCRRSQLNFRKPAYLVARKSQRRCVGRDVKNLNWVPFDSLQAILSENRTERTNVDEKMLICGFNSIKGHRMHDLFELRNRKSNISIRVIIKSMRI